MEQILNKPFFKRVLVIDDNSTDRYIAKRMIQKYQFSEEIILKESASKALKYLLSLVQTPELLPQFIFLDIRMPEMDGFGFLDEYANLPETIKSNCVIMMLSTSLDPEDHQRAENSPYVNRFLNKPLDKQNMENLEQEFTVNKLGH